MHGEHRRHCSQNSLRRSSACLGVGIQGYCIMDAMGTGTGRGSLKSLGWKAELLTSAVVWGSMGARAPGLGSLRASLIPAAGVSDWLPWLGAGVFTHGSGAGRPCAAVGTGVVPAAAGRFTTAP